VFYAQNQNTINSFAMGLVSDENYPGPCDDASRLSRAGLAKVGELAEKSGFDDVITKYAFKEFSKNNFAENFGKIVAKPVKYFVNKSTLAVERMTFQCHHIFPQTYRAKFAQLGVNVDNPIFAAWWQSTIKDPEAHQALAKAVNDRWAVVFNMTEQYSKSWGKNSTAYYQRSVNLMMKEVMQQAIDYKFKLSFNPVGLVSDMDILKHYESFTPEAWKTIVDSWKESKASGSILKELKLDSFDALYLINK